MNHSQLAPRANPGGALPRRSSACIEFLGVLARRACSRIGSPLRKLIMTGACVFAAIHASGAPSVTLAWDANAEPDIAGYELSYGVSSGVYTSTADAGLSTTIEVGGLTEGKTYYFVVSAYSTGGLKSLPSSQVSYTVPPNDPPPNTAPSAIAQTLTTAEDTPLNIGLTGTDAEGAALGYTVVTAPRNGTLTGSAPNLTYVPAGNFGGDDSFTFQVNDGTLISATATVSITVTAVNDAPIATGKLITTTEDTPLPITLTGTDPDANNLTFSVVTAPANGTLTGTAPNLTYNPAANFTGADSFTFRVNDGTVNSAPATISIMVTAINDAPLATAHSATTAEDTPIPITLAGTDPDRDSLTFSVVTAPAHGALTGTAPNLTYSPAANFNGSDSFTFRVNDGKVNSATATISITVTAVNDAPLATANSVTTAEDTPVPITLSGTDPDANSLIFSVVNAPAHGALTGTAPNLTYSPAANFTGADSFTFRVNDGSVNSATATISITVTALNDAPIATGNSVMTAQDTPLPITLTGTDPDANSLTFSVVTAPAHGTLAGTAPNLTYSPAANFTGADSFTFRVNDGTVNSTTATVSIAVISTPSGVWSLHYVDSQESQTYQGAHAFDGNPGTFWHTKWSGSPTPPPHEIQIHLGATQNISGFRYLPRQDDRLVGNVGQFEFYVSADGVNWGNPVATGTFPNTREMKEIRFTQTSARYIRLRGLSDANGGIYMTVAELEVIQNSQFPVTNQAPLALSKSISTDEDTAANIVLQGSNADGDILTFSVVSAPTKGTLSGIAPNLTYTPSANYNGTDSFTYLANDGGVNSANATVSITVTPVNDAPLATANSVSTAEDSLLPVTLGGTDPDGNPLTFTVVGSPANGTLSGTPPNLTYQPAANFNGNDAFSFRVNDGAVESLPATILITVTPINDAPLANSKAVTAVAGIAIPINLTGTDPDADHLTFALVAAPAHGTLAGTAPNLTYTPAANYAGGDQFTFRVNDGTVNSATATISITVSSTNTPPFFTAGLTAFTATADQAFAGQLVALDADPSDIATIQKVSGPAWLTISADGKLEGTPLDADVGIASFIVKASDQANASVTATLNITVTKANEAPVFAVKPLVYPAGTAKEPYLQSLANTATDSDPDDTITYSKVDGPAWLVIAKTGALSGTPPDGSVGINLFTVRATDAAGASAETTLQIQINSNDLPLPWNLDPVGTSNLAGARKLSSGIFTVAGAGLLADRQHSGSFVSQTLTGDGQITARVSKLHNTGKAARVGVMIRESLAANSRQIFMGVNGTSTYHWLRRSGTGGSTSKTTKTVPSTAATWVRLVRSGNTVTAYRSTNGKSWIKMGSSKVKMSKNCYIGLWVSSGSKTLQNTSQFNKVVVTP